MLECIGAHLRRAARQKEELVMAMMNDSNLDEGLCFVFLFYLFNILGPNFANTIKKKKLI